MNTKIMFFSVAMLFVMGLFAAKKDAAYQEARRSGAWTKIELHVADDDGAPVPGARVKALLGMNFRQLGKWVEGNSDTNGVFVLEGKTCGDEVEVCVAKEGYYSTKMRLCYATMGAERKVVGGRWQPYGDVLPVRCRKVKAPAALSVMSTRSFRNTKCINKWVGYDLQFYDYVKPYGAGQVSDFEVFMDWDGKWLPEYRGMELRIRFPCPFAGYCQTNAVTESEFVGPYLAPSNLTYRKEAAFSERISDEGTRVQAGFNRNRCWILRTRCEVDDRGNLVSANYGVIHNIECSCEPGGIVGLCVMGAFNTTPNDTNLEDEEIAKQSRHYIRHCEPPSEQKMQGK